MMAKPEGGRFDESTYERARKWREQQEAKSAAPKAEAKAAAPKKQPSKVAVPAKPVRGKAAERTQDAQAKDRRAMQDTIASAEKKQSDKKFEESVRSNLKTSERDEMNKYKDRAVAAGTAAASLVPALRMAGTAASGARAPSGASKLSKSREVAEKFDKITPIPNRPMLDAPARNLARRGSGTKQLGSEPGKVGTRASDGTKRIRNRTDSVMKYAKGGSVDGCAMRGKTKGRMM
jgi:hypothetical protein